MIRAGRRGLLSGFGTVIADRFLASDGTAALPAYGYTSEAGLGDYRSASGRAAVATASTLRMWWDAVYANSAGLFVGTGTIQGAALTSTGALSYATAETASGTISPTQLAVSTDNWAPTGLSTASRIRIDVAGAIDLTGITAGALGRRIRLINITASTITLKHDVTSTAANRFYCPGAVDFSLTQYRTVEIEYDTTFSRWMVQ